MIILPILGALALAGGTILERQMLKKKSMNIKKYQTLEFLGIIIILLPFLYFFWKLDSQAFELKNILIFLGVIVVSIIANLFTFYSMKGEKINNLEPAKMLEPLFTILLAVVFAALIGGVYEQNSKVIIPALIAGITLILLHVKKEHLNLNKYFIAAIIGSFFFALELVISRLILDYYSPITFYFLRCFVIFFISLTIFRPQLKNIEGKLKLKLLFIGAIWVVYRVAVYYGYLKLGIISTTLILMLGPIFIYAFAKIFLKEKLNWRNIVASVIILGCILYALLI